MDFEDYYSKSFKGFTENPKLALPTLLQQVILLAIMTVMGALLFFSFFGTDFLITGNFNPSSADFAALMLMFGLFYIIFLILSLIITSYMSAATVGMSKSIINGERPDLGVGFRNGNKHFLKIIAVSLIMMVILMIFVFPTIIGFFVDSAYDLTPTLTFIGGLVSLFLWLVTGVLFIFTYQSIVVCGESVVGSIKDSIKLLRENIFDVIIVLIINIIIAFSIGFLFGIVNFVLSFIPILGSILSMILQVIMACIINPFFVLVLTYVYMDKKDLIRPHNEDSEQIN